MPIPTTTNTAAAATSDLKASIAAATSSGHTIFVSSSYSSSSSNISTVKPVPNVPQDYLGTSPIIYGTSAFAQMYNPIEPQWPAEACARAIDLGINTFDTSPYYGNSEEVLGQALREIKETHPRSSYYLSTKVGRYGPKKVDFDYSAETVRKSVERSMTRMCTDYLDIVFAHDVEFVSVDAAVEAVGELFRLKAEGKIRYVGISGYPLPYLLALIPVLHERHNQKLDILLTYCHYNLHNTLLKDYVLHFKDLGLTTVWNASPLSMGLLRSFTPAPEWHPAPARLHSAVQDCIQIVNKHAPGKDLAEVAVKFAMKWKGCEGLVLGMSNPAEVESNIRWWNQVQEQQQRPHLHHDLSTQTHSKDKQQQQQQHQQMEETAEERDERLVRLRLEGFAKMEWASPPIDDC